MNSEVGLFETDSYHESVDQLTLTDLREIKQMLLSGDKDRVFQSVEKIQLHLHNENSVSELIRSDISEFLCDAMIPFDVLTFSGIFKCLEPIVQHIDFYIQCHCSLVIDSLIRSIHFLLKNLTASSNLSDCLNLIELITKGYIKFNIEPERENIENVLQLLLILLKSDVLLTHNKHQIGCIIFNLTELSYLLWNDDCLALFGESFLLWIDAIGDIFLSDVPLKGTLIFLCSFICHFILKNITSRSMASYNVGLQDVIKQRDDLLSQISNFLVNVEAPFLNGLPLTEIENEHSKAEIFFQSILCFFDDDKAPHKPYITHGLGEVGFLQFVTRVISFAHFGNSEGLRKLGVSVLSHIVMFLADDVLQISQIWGKGLEDFRCEIQSGFSQLPLDASQWLDFLISPESPNACKIALLLYLYFYCLTAKSQCILATIYPSIVTFIDCSTGIESSVLLVKVVWFVYVMSQLSCIQSQTSEIQPEITSKVVSMLQVQENLDLVYTHHPALLYWVFSTDMSSNIQAKIVHLWLRNKTSDCRELKDLIAKSSDVRFAILDVLQNECNEVLDSAFSTLHSVLIETSDDNLISNLWFLLPQILAKYTADSVSAKNVDYIIELCSLKTPRNLDFTKAIRIASLLPEILVYSDLLSIVPALTLIHRLLELALDVEDLRVMQVLIRFNNFLIKIVEGLESDVSDIVWISLKIMSLLWQHSGKFHEATKKAKVRIKQEILFSVLSNPFVQVLAASLEFLQQILRTGFKSQVFEIVKFNANFVEILFFEVQSICVKDPPAISSAYWQCLKLFLLLKEFSHLSLASDPLFHEIIHSHLSRYHEHPEMRDFLILWVDLNDSTLNKSCFERSIFGEYFRETVQNIAHHLASHFKEDDRVLYNKGIITVQILMT